MTGGALQGQFFFELIGPLVFIAFSIGFAGIRRYVPHLASAGYFALSYLLRSCGFMADYFRSAMQPDIAIYATVIPFLAAGIAFMAGMFHLYRVRVPWRVLAFIGGTALALVSWFRLVDDSVVMRVIVMNGTSAAALAYLVFALHGRMTRGIDRFLQIVFIANAAQFVLRTAVALWLEGPTLTAANYADSLAAISLRFSIIVATLVIAATLFAIYGMEIVRRLTRTSEIDPLTGVLNRRGLENRMSSIIHNGPAGEARYAVVMADIDGFKAVNDTYGHEAGDAVIEALARVLGEAAREGDFVARWGGEEFLVVLANAEIASAQLYAEAVRRQWEILLHDCLGGNTVTASFGVACWRNGQDLSGVSRQADAALYRAKRQGRNRVCVDEPEFSPAPLAAVVA